MSDIALADRCIADFGVVLVDDILNSHWLGVIEVFAAIWRGLRCLWRIPPAIVPFAIHSNKLFL